MNNNGSYDFLCSMSNLILAWRKARKNKTTNKDVVEFERNLEKNLLELHEELKNKTYKPKPLTIFVLKDPKTRVISKSYFRDRIVHHAIILVIGNLFERQFIYDSCSNQIGKGSSFAIERFKLFSRKITINFKEHAFCLKADIKHYFEEVDHKILIKIISRRVNDKNILFLIETILKSNTIQFGGKRLRGMPLGNYTSQFFGNVYLHDLDYFVKHILKVEYYIRYVDDFVIFHSSKKQLEIWKNKIDEFLKEKLKIQLHPQKSRIIPLSRGIDFVGFRNFPYYRLLRKRNIRNMKRKIELFRKGAIDFKTLADSYQGWQAYAIWGNTHNLRKRIKAEIIDLIWDRINFE